VLNDNTTPWSEACGNVVGVDWANPTSAAFMGALVGAYLAKDGGLRSVWWALLSLRTVNGFCRVCGHDCRAEWAYDHSCWATWRQRSSTTRPNTSPKRPI